MPVSLEASAADVRLPERERAASADLDRLEQSILNEAFRIEE